MADRSKVLKARRNAEYAAGFKRRSRKQRRALRRQQTLRREHRWLDQNGLLVPVVSVCPAPGCGALTDGGRCATHKRQGSPRRHAKQREQGKDTRYWREELRPAVLERDQHTCRDCGATEDLTVDLVNATLEGDHRRATIDDCVTRCRSCHGSKDAPRASRGRRRNRRGGGLTSGRDRARPAPSTTRETSTTP